MEDLILTLTVLGFIVFIAMIWFLPVFIAKKRQTEDRGIIILLSFLGLFTGITWIVALCMACFKQSNKHKKQQNAEKS